MRGRKLQMNEMRRDEGMEQETDRKKGSKHKTQVRIISKGTPIGK